MSALGFLGFYLEDSGDKKNKCAQKQLVRAMPGPSRELQSVGKLPEESFSCA